MAGWGFFVLDFLIITYAIVVKFQQNSAEFRKKLYKKTFLGFHGSASVYTLCIF